ncbi:hypothetical protein GH733_018334 [Mirounga leonina]|nr:hypothetical protein GH733_018334 [Mirounga leonina]
MSKGGMSPRLQTVMWGAFGKHQGAVARIRVRQVFMSICTHLQNKEHVIEALCRAKFKFPDCQKIHISKKQGFPKFNVDEFGDKVSLHFSTFLLFCRDVNGIIKNTDGP